jgi:hypothetical protein
MFSKKAGAYPSESPFKLLALTTNTKLGWKGLTGKNTPAYNNLNYGCKEYYNIGPRSKK